MGLLDLLQQGYQNYKQSDTPFAALLRNEPQNIIPTVTRNLEQQLSLLQTPEGAVDLINPVSKIGGLLGSIKIGNKSFPQFSPEAVMAYKQTYEIPKPQRISSRPIPDKIIKERNALLDGKITNSEYYAKQNKLYPFTYFKEVPELTNVFDIGKALKHAKLPSEEAIKGQVKGGRAILGLGASIDDGTIRELAVKYMDNPEWVQVAFNPTKSGHFMDKIKGIPVTEADEVIQIGPLVLAKNVKYDLNLQPFSK